VNSAVSEVNYWLLKYAEDDSKNIFISVGKSDRMSWHRDELIAGVDLFFREV
jgi:hypothetical protein